MSRTLTLNIPDEVYRPLRKRAHAEGRTMEEVAADCLAASVLPEGEDPLLSLAGALSSDMTNVSDRHDDYVTDHLVKELHEAER